MQPTTVLLNPLLLTCMSRVQMTLPSETIVILEALLLTLSITVLCVLRIGTLVLTVVVTGLLTRNILCVLVFLVDLPTVCCLIRAELQGM